MFPPFGQPSANDSLHVNFPMMLDMVVNLYDIPNTKLDFDLLPCPPPHKLKKSYDCIWKFQLEWGTKLPWVEGVLPLIVFFTMLDARFVAPLTRSHVCLLPSGIH